jgi:O-succinylbenzoate synthase
VIFVSEYTLVPRAALSALAGAAPRRGALIRVDGGVADVHPWPELGDDPLEVQLARLARGETTSLTRRSLTFARADAAARAAGRSLFESLTIPESHWPGSEPPEGFRVAKIKFGARIPDGVRLRIDYNALLSADEFLEVASSLPVERVDFVEDPCPYDAATWRMLRERTGLRLALDRGFETDGVDVWVVKPAVQPLTPALSPPGGEGVPKAGEGRPIVVTSYMDHPVGQLHAAHVAAQHATEACGLITHVLYEPNEFSESLRLDGARLVPPPGTGVGFDDALERLAWKRLA